MKVYKGTDKDIKCRGYQFTPGVEAVEGSAKLCSSGFHACEAPLDVLAYYAPGGGSRYFEAELNDVSNERHSVDTKVCGKRITLGAEIGIPGLVKAHIEYVKSKCEQGKKGGDSSALTGGNWSALTGGDSSALTGGNWSALTGGNRSALTGGNWSALTGGDSSALTGGNWSALTGGNRSALTGGDWSALRAGQHSRFRGGMWSVFACEIRDEDYNLVGVKTAVVDGETIKPNVWYKLVDGEWMEVQE